MGGEQIQEPSPGARRFEVLLADYQSLRDDERNFLYVQATILAAVVTTLTVATAVLVATKQPNLVIAGLPLAPLGVLLYLALIGNVATIRSFYLRAIERELHDAIEDRDLRAVPGVQVASFAHLTQGLTSPRTGNRRTHIQVATLLGLMLVVFGGMAVYAVAIIQDNNVLRIIMVVVYVIGTVILVDGFYSGVIRGRAQWVALVTKTSLLLRRPLDRLDIEHSKEERKLISYLLIPRVPELLVKSWFYLTGFLIGYLSAAQNSGGSPVTLGIGFLVLDLLAYQARYQINDLRGQQEDRAHPSAGLRGRLPAGPGSDIASAITVYFKIGLALVLSLTVAPQPARWPLVFAITITLVTTLPYESLKSRIASDDDAHLSVLTRAKMALFVLVGLGYAVRAATGMYVGHGGALSANLFMLAVVMMSTFGTMFVTMTWTLEATDYVVCQNRMSSRSTIAANHRDADASSVKTLGPGEDVDELTFEGQAPAYKMEISRRGHLAALLAQSGFIVAGPRIEQVLRAEYTSGATIRALSRLDPRVGLRYAVKQIWNWAFLIAACCATPLGYGLAKVQLSDVEVLIILLITLGIALTLVVLVRPRVMAALVAAAVTLLQVSAFMLSDLPPRQWILPALPFAVVAVSYSTFRFLNYRDLTRPLPTPLQIAVVITRSLSRFAVASLTYTRSSVDLPESRRGQRPGQDR